MTTHDRRHILVRSLDRGSYEYRGQGVPVKPKRLLPARDAKEHTDHLNRDLARIESQASEVDREGERLGLANEGLLLTFQVTLSDELDLDMFEDRGAGISRRSYQEVNESQGLVNVFVPHGRLRWFERRIAAYLDETKAGKRGRKNCRLIDSIESVGTAALDALWTDQARQLPRSEARCWWEAWIQRDCESRFVAQARCLGLSLGEQVLRFIDRAVMLIHATPNELRNSIALLDTLAELRAPDVVCRYLARLPTYEQHRFIDDLLSRMKPPASDAPAVTLLDTGIDAQHPLLATALDDSDVLSYGPPGHPDFLRFWSPHDRSGHGTEMAGLALFGTSLATLLQSDDVLVLRHRLESVKTRPDGGLVEMPTPGTNDDALDLPLIFGEITQAAAARAELNAPQRKRVFSMPVAGRPCPDGQPSSWSAAVDALAYDASGDGDSPRLVLLSAGNVYPGDDYVYPDTNHNSAIEDPGQAWNAITVGGFTRLSTFDDAPTPALWRCIAPPDDLSPSSCTSTPWDDPWPNKPDLVCEAGNLVEPLDGGMPDWSDDLLVLTTACRQKTGRLLVPSGMTSAATSICASMAAQIVAEYPALWPETIRGLLVHSARWTPAMERRADEQALSKRRRINFLLRCFGYGVPDLERALYSARNHVTMIVEDTLQPFGRDENRKPVTNEMHLHRLPWPDSVLEMLGEVAVRLRVTLSYFVEPAPGRRGPTNRYAYASHQLRFETITGLESEERFLKRVNPRAREKGEKAGSSDVSEWMLGPDCRERGSIHSDVWCGPASRLLERNRIAVVPVIGWWRERPALGHVDRQARYSLIVSIETDATELAIGESVQLVDLYSPVAQTIELLA